MSFGCQWGSVALVAIERDVFEELSFREGSNILTPEAVVLSFEEKVSGGSLGGITGDVCCPRFSLSVGFFTVGHLDSSVYKRDRVVDELFIRPH